MKGRVNMKYIVTITYERRELLNEVTGVDYGKTDELDFCFDDMEAAGRFMDTAFQADKTGKYQCTLRRDGEAV
jgi:hypothetical protein